MKIWFSVILSWLSLTLFAQSEVPALERTITLNLKNQPVATILTTIAMQADFIFSYSPEVVNSTDIRSISISQKSVRQALNMLFDGNVQFKERGKYVILKKAEAINASNKDQLIEGYVIDARSGKKLTETSIYEKQLLASVITDKYGYFRIAVPSDQIKSGMRISKRGYADTMITKLQGKTSFVNIELSSKDTATEYQPFDETFGKTTTKHSRLQRFLISKNIRINTRNVTDTIFKKVQISLLPFISTNKLLTGSTVNSLSLNLTVGYVQGVRTAEVGGILNMVRGNVQFVQLGGVGNMVGGSNKGLQAAGVYNITKNIKGVQLAGVANIVRDSAGICQAAGVFNQAKEVNGIQIAGVLNNASKVNGLQVSGLINRANYIKGVQISILNFADSCVGVPIGILSFVKNGVHNIEISSDELFYTNIAIRTGVQKFHTMVMVGMRPDNFKTPLWYYGYGIGTTLGKKNLGYDIELSEQEISKGNFSSSLNMMYKIYFGVDKKITPKTSIALGVDYNVYLSDTKSSDYQTKYSSILPYYFSDKTFHNGVNMKTWLGAKLALRF
jgi:hypothetical protein